MEKMKMETVDGVRRNIDKIAEIFPNCITEVANNEGGYKRSVNYELLKQMLSDEVTGDEESYEFTWVGKKSAIVEANKPIKKVLRPKKEESIDWEHTQNIYIKGDNLEALKLLQESYLEDIKLIYIDPPYNTGHDFIYPDSFVMDNEDYNNGSNYYDEDGNINYSRENTEMTGKYHSDWCSMMYSRLLLARNLLAKDGVILVSIGDRELKNLIAIMDEVFGASNQVCNFVWKSRSKPTNAGNSKYRPQKVSEYVLAYSKSKPDEMIFNVIPAKERVYPHEDQLGRFRTTTILTSNRGTFRRETMRFESHGFQPNEDYRWKAGKETIDSLYETNHMFINDDGIPMEKKYENEESDPLYPIYTLIDNELSGTAENGKTELGRLVGKRHGFDTVKPVQLMKYLIQTFTDEDDVILDFFSGAATTAQAVLEQNMEDGKHRKYILIQLSEPIKEDSEAYLEGFRNICDIGLKRLIKLQEKFKDVGNDFGLRVFELDESNMNEVYYTIEDYTQENINYMESNIKADRTDLDLLFGCVIDWGLPLSLPYTSEEISGVMVHTYNDGDLIACFDENIPEVVVKEIAKRQPLRAVFRDSSFNDSPSKINVGEIFKSVAPDTSVKVI